jgi:hypothetical protein
MPGGLGAFAIVVAAGVLVLVMVLVWLLSREASIYRTSFGFYVERKRDELPFEQGEPPTEAWPERKPD